MRTRESVRVCTKLDYAGMAPLLMPKAALSTYFTSQRSFKLEKGDKVIGSQRTTVLVILSRVALCLQGGEFLLFPEADLTAGHCRQGSGPSQTRTEEWAGRPLLRKAVFAQRRTNIAWCRLLLKIDSLFICNLNLTGHPAFYFSWQS